MGLTVEYRDSGRGIMCTASGTLTGREFVKAIKEVFSCQPVAEPYYYSLFDTGGVEAVHVTADDIRQVAAEDIEASRKNPQLVCAIYAGSNLAYGLARMWQMLVEQSGWKTNVFRSRSDAVAWLKMEVFTTFGLKIDIEEFQ